MVILCVFLCFRRVEKGLPIRFGHAETANWVHLGTFGERSCFLLVSALKWASCEKFAASLVTKRRFKVTSQTGGVPRGK